VRDSGIVHALLNIGDYQALLGHPVSGSSSEGFVIENLIAASPPHTRRFVVNSGMERLAVRSGTKVIGLHELAGILAAP
jgi:hypothetical protein